MTTTDTRHTHECPQCSFTWECPFDRCLRPTDRAIICWRCDRTWRKWNWARDRLRRLEQQEKPR
jgi:hypothetical protein